MIISSYKKYISDHMVNQIKRRDSHVLIYNGSSNFTVVNAALEKIATPTLPKYIDIDFVPNQERIIYSTDERVHIVDYQMNAIATIETERAQIYVQDEYLWLASMHGDDYLEVSLHKLADLSKITSIEIEDENYFDASVSIYPGYDKNLILWVSQGQDGFWNLLLKLENDALSFEYVGEGFILPIRYHANDERINYWLYEQYLSVTKEGDGGVSSIYNLALNDYDFVTSADFLNEHYVLFLAENGLFVFDVQNEKAFEVVVDGFEPRIEKYDNPSFDDARVVDFHELEIIDDSIFLSYKSETETGFLEFSKSAILEKI